MSSPAVPTWPLSHGPSIPIVGYGLGTARTSDAEETTISQVSLALRTGFTHIDGAESYGNESPLGKGIASAASDVPRSKFFLTTKVYKSISSPSKALSQSLHKLQTEYVDLYLIHAPFWDESKEGITIEEAWGEMEKLLDSGKAKAIGVSNFRVKDLERIRKVAKVLPAVNQIEYHPYLQSSELVEYNKKHNIQTVAYAPLIPLTKATGGPLDPLVEKLTKKYNVSSTQLLLRWIIDSGVVAITTTSKEARMKEALLVSGFKLDKEDVEEIAKVGLQKEHRAFWTDKSW